MIGFMRDLAFAIRKKGLRALADAIPFAGSLVDIVADALQRRKARHEKAELKEDIAMIARIESRVEARRVAAEIAREVVDRGPLEIQLQLEENGQVPSPLSSSEAIEFQLQLENYLTQVPQALRQSLRRPEDPSGKTVPARFDDSPEHIAQMLPQRLPRFQAGDKPDCLRGEWVLEELLGSGGFGEVWKARHADFDGTVAAIKFCLDPAAQDRLLKHEGQLINQVMKHGSHPGIVPLLDASLRTNPPWRRYEFIPGGDLLLLFNKLKPLSIADRLKTALPFFQKLCEAVGHFHRLNPPVVHRDLKPSNILMMKTPGGYRLRIADFGISQLAARHTLEQADDSGPNFSMASKLRGAHSLHYSSPQQRDGEPADVRDDVYSLGIILYQLLKADPNAERPGGLDWADELRESGVAEEVVKLIGSCIADRIDRRPKDGSRIAEALKALQVPPPPDRKEKTADELKLKVVTNFGDRALFPNVTHSRSIGSLKTGDIRLEIGDIIEIHGEGKQRRVTDVMGSKGNFQATFKGQGQLPTGDLAWRIVSRAVAQLSGADGGDSITKGPDRSSAKPPHARFGALKLGSRFTNEIGMEFTWIPAGHFLMGSPKGVGEDNERPQHPVTISRGFFMGIHPVTQQEWERLMKNNPSNFKGERNPVEQVSWNDCQDFFGRLLDIEERYYRLPSEAEWEYACRAGTTTEYFFGDTDGRLGEFAWFDGNSDKTTHPVGQKKANPWGLHDVVGNVWEWCADWYGPYAPEKQTDPAGAASGGARVLRGGSRGCDPAYCRSADRYWGAPGVRINGFGVRVVFCVD